MQIRLLTNEIELWKWKVRNKWIISTWYYQALTIRAPVFFALFFEPNIWSCSKKASLQIFFRSLPTCTICTVECMHFFKFEQHGLCQFYAGLHKWQKDYLIMTRPISTLYGMLSHFDDILSRKSCICETLRLRCSSHDKSPRIWFNNVI